MGCHVVLFLDPRKRCVGVWYKRKRRLLCIGDHSQFVYPLFDTARLVCQAHRADLGAVGPERAGKAVCMCGVCSP